jgi:NADH/NAD ratio-sensing transcriptional regulator Rex
MKHKQINFQVTRQQYDDLKKHIAKRGVDTGVLTIAEYLRRLIAEDMKHETKQEETQ